MVLRTVFCVDELMAKSPRVWLLVAGVGRRETLSSCLMLEKETPKRER